MLKTTTANTKLLVGEDPFRRFLRDRVLFPIARFRPLQRRNAAIASQLQVSYRRGPLGGGSRFSSKPHPGDRIPDLDCERPDHSMTRLHAELGARWALLVPREGAGGCAGAATIGLGEFVGVLTRTDQGKEVWLIRPDAHLAWRGGPDPDALRRWLDNALKTGGTSR